MKSLRPVVFSIVVALLAVPLSAVPAHATGREAPAEASAPTGIDPPRDIDVRFDSYSDPLAVDVLSRVHPVASTSQRVTVQVAVRPLDGGSRLLGPVLVADVGSQTSSVSVSRDGGVTGHLLLTAQQARELSLWRGSAGDVAAAGAVTVLLRHEVDSDPATPGYEDVASAGSPARYHGDPLALAVQTRENPGTVVFTNTLSHPIVLLSGPAQCIYDTVYGIGTEGGDGAGSYLGSANGTLLYPNQTISISVDKDHSDLDGKTSDGQGAQVIADYQAAVYQAYRWAGNADVPDLPLVLGSDADKSAWKTITEESGLFAGGVLNSMLEGFSVYSTWAQAAGFAALEQMGIALDVVEILFELSMALVALFEGSCDGAPGYILIGATDVYQPWRSTSQTYSWNGANPVPATVKTQSHGKQPSLPGLNGMVMNLLTPQFTPVPGQPVPAPVRQPSFDGESELYLPNSKGSGQWQWRIAVPPTVATKPSGISLVGRTVTCTNQQLADFTNAMQATGAGVVKVDTGAGNIAFYDISTGAQVAQPSSATWNSDYLVGEGFVPGGQPQATVQIYSGSPTSGKWSSLPVPWGSTSVAIPGGTQAVWIRCNVQVPELLPASLPSDRTVLFGTNVPSDLIPGPDYYLP